MRDFQRCAAQILKSGQSVIIIAPTGLGKTRAALQPFLDNFANGGLLGTRLIYALPLRALARGPVEEFQNLGASFNPVVHHGDEPESQFFSERAVITTIDQYLTAFAGAPLSWASHLSHAAAGAVLTSYSVFDEVHLLSPQKGLPLLFAMLYLRQRWGLLSCVMTATLPSSVIKFLQEYCRLAKIEASNSDIQERDGWRYVYLECIGHRKQATAGRSKRRRTKSAEDTSSGSEFEWIEKDENALVEFVKEKWNEWPQDEVTGPQKIIVFVNTVDRAVNVYEQLEKASLVEKPKILLAHSRFTKDDRKVVEDNLQRYFGKSASPDPAILVTTQVAEAGLNISAPLVITELCPMDSLIQRAGRCQRFKPDDGKEAKGKVLVVKPAGERWYVPYSDRIRVVPTQQKQKGSKPFPAIEITRLVLEGLEGPTRLDWQKEKELIDKALDRIYQTYLQGQDEIEFQDGEEPYQTLYKTGKKEVEEEEPLEEETE